MKRIIPALATLLLCSAPAIAQSVSGAPLQVFQPLGSASSAGGSPGGSAGDIQDNAGASTFGASALNDNGTIVKSTESIDTKTNATVWEIPNASSVGTTLSKLAKLTGAPSTALITATTDVSGALGVVIGGAGTTGSAQVAITGQASCVFDGATTAGHYVINSATVAGDCSDAGAGEPNGKTVVGIVLSTNAAGGTFGLSLFPPTESSISASSGTAGKPCTATNNSIQYDNTGLFGCAPSIVNSGVWDFTPSGTTIWQLSGSAFFYRPFTHFNCMGIGACTNVSSNNGPMDCFGDGACGNVTSDGGDYTAFGDQTCGDGSASGGSANVCFGYQAGKAMAGGNGSNTYIGSASGVSANVGFDTCVGGGTCPNSNGNNAVVGQAAGGSFTSSAASNSLLGRAAGTAITNGSADICIGRSSCLGLTTGSRDIVFDTNGASSTCTPSAVGVNDELDLCGNSTSDTLPIERCNLVSLAAGSCTFNVPLVAGGSPPTLTGTCTTATQTGGNAAGSFAATCTAQTVIMTFGSTAPHGWVCLAQDQTTSTDTLKQTAGSASTTSCTLTGTTIASDVIVFTATAF